jgi:hypothetical protein
MVDVWWTQGERFACRCAANERWDDLTRHQEIEEHTDRGEMLLHGGRRARMVLDIGGDHDGTDLFKRPDAMQLAPGEELPDGLCICGPRVPVSDRSYKELDEAPRGSFTRAADRSRQPVEPGAGKVA